MPVKKISLILASGIFILCCLISGCNIRQDSSSIYLDRAAKQIKQKRFAQARSSIESAIKTSATRKETYYSAIALYQGSKHYEEACEIAQRFESLKLFRSLSKQEKTIFYTNLAGIYYCKKDIPQAEHYYKHALALTPDSPQILNALGYIYADEGIKLNQALKLTKRAVELSPDDGIILDSLGWAQYKLGDYKKAAQTLKKAVELNPNEAELRFHLGAAYKNLGRLDEARIEIHKSLLLDKNMTKATILLKTIHK